jgi:hypothetical protein
LWTAMEQITRTTINEKCEEARFYFILKSRYPVAFQKYGLAHLNKNCKEGLLILITRIFHGDAAWFY